MKKERKITTVLLCIYLVIVTWIILFKMELSIASMPHYRGINLIPFAGSLIVNGKIQVQEIVDNLIIFIPVGVFLSMLKSRWSFWEKVLPIFSLSLLYEVLQYVLAIGATDITDVLSNTLGGIVGILIFGIFSKLLGDKTIKVLNRIAIVCILLVLGLMGVLIAVNL